MCANLRTELFAKTVPLGLPGFGKSDISTGEKKAAERTKRWGAFPRSFVNTTGHTPLRLNEQGNSDPATVLTSWGTCYK